MARARLLKPSFFLNDVLANCCPLARILFSGLWTLADREGRLEDRPQKIKASVLPYDNCNIDDLLNELDAADFIIRYTIDNNDYIQVLAFTKHQHPHHRENASIIPAPDKPRAKPELALDKTGTSPSLTLNPLTLTLNPEPRACSEEKIKENIKLTPEPPHEKKLSPPPTPAPTPKPTAAPKPEPPDPENPEWFCGRIIKLRKKQFHALMNLSCFDHDGFFKYLNEKESWWERQPVYEQTDIFNRIRKDLIKRYPYTGG